MKSKQQGNEVNAMDFITDVQVTQLNNKPGGM